MFSRRAFLLTTGLAATAGCSQTNNSPSTPEEYRDQAEFETTIFTSRDNATIPAEDYLAFEFNSDGTKEILLYYELAVLEGHPIDVFVLDAEEYTKYRNGEPANPSAKHSAFEVTDEEHEGYLPQGDYAVVFNNTDATGTKPASEVRIEYAIEASTK